MIVVLRPILCQAHAILCCSRSSLTFCLIIPYFLFVPKCEINICTFLNILILIFLLTPVDCMWCHHGHYTSVFSFCWHYLCVSTDQGSDTGRLTPQSRRPTPEREVEMLISLVSTFIWTSFHFIEPWFETGRENIND